VEYYFSNDELALKNNTNIKEFQQKMKEIGHRDFLLSLRVLYFEVDFGSNKYVDNFTLAFDYEIYSRSMLSLQMSSKYQPRKYSGPSSSATILRYLEMLFAVLLLVAYSVEARDIYYNTQMDRVLRKNSLYWCISLLMLNFVALASDRLAPLCAMMQLLPIFEHTDSSETMPYNFNVNLRYALPIVLRIVVPVYIILNGFIFYSMLMYPGDYFDDYITAFFSYFYNNFQYGIY
jgi:hypothetical protein